MPDTPTVPLRTPAEAAQMASDWADALVDDTNLRDSPEPYRHMLIISGAVPEDLDGTDYWHECVTALDDLCTGSWDGEPANDERIP